MKGAFVFRHAIGTLVLFFGQSFAWASTPAAKSDTVPAEEPRPTSGKILHPQAAEGLVQIRRDGSYLYRVPEKPRSRSFALKIASMVTPPGIRNSQNNTTYASIYGESSVTLALFEYEWMLAGRIGLASLMLGTGFGNVRGRGVLQDSVRSQAEEVYNLYLFPLSFGGTYRMDFSHRQWLVPHVGLQATYFGVAEKREDVSALRLVGAPAWSMIGGLNLALSRASSRLGAQFEREYGLADLWISFEARQMRGAKTNLDFTSLVYVVGMTSDF